MDTELLYLVIFGLIMAFCCYHMMSMMMDGSGASDQPESTSSEKMQAESSRIGSERVGEEKIAAQEEPKK